MDSKKILGNLQKEMYRCISKNNYTLIQFSVICEISYDSLCKIIYGKRKDIHISTLLKICDNAGIDILNVLDVKMPETIQISVKSGGIEFSGEISNKKIECR